LEREGVSKSELAKRLAAVTGRTSETWRRSLNKYAIGREPTEATVDLIASALGVNRDEFPPALPRGLQLERAYAELAQEHAELKRAYAALSRSLKGSPSDTQMDEVERGLVARLVKVMQDVGDAPGDTTKLDLLDDLASIGARVLPTREVSEDFDPA